MLAKWRADSEHPGLRLLSLRIFRLDAGAAAAAVGQLRAREPGVPATGRTGPVNAIDDVQDLVAGRPALNAGRGILRRGVGPVRAGVTATSFPQQGFHRAGVPG